MLLAAARRRDARIVGQGAPVIDIVEQDVGDDVVLVNWIAVTERWTTFG